MGQFEVRYLDKHSREEDWEEVKAYDAEDAAATYADQWDQEERYMIRDGQACKFEVRDGAGNVTTWSVYGEAQPRYYAYPTEPPRE